MFQFADIWADEVVQHDFVIHNDGEGPLELIEVESADCRAEIKSDKVIAPGADGKVSATLHVPRISGGPSEMNIASHILVKSNDPKQPKVTLDLHGRVKPFIGVDPTDMEFGNLSTEEESTRTVKVTNYTDTPMKLEPIPPSGQEKIFMVEVKEIEPGKVAEVTVTARKPPYMPGRTHYTHLDFSTGIEKAKYTGILCAVTVGEPGPAASNSASTESYRAMADVKVKDGQAAKQPSEPSEWIETLSSHLRWPRDKIGITRQEDGTCVYELPFGDKPISDLDWRMLCELKSPGAPLVVHGPPESVSAAGPAVRFIVRQRAVWPASQRFGSFEVVQSAETGSEPEAQARQTRGVSFGLVPANAASQPARTESLTPMAPDERPHLKNLKMPPNRELWIEMDLVTDGRVLNLNRLKIPANAPVFDQRIFGPYVQDLPAFDPEAVKPPEEPGVAAEVIAKLRQLRIGMTRAVVDKVLTLQDDRRDGAWTTYYRGHADHNHRRVRPAERKGPPGQHGNHDQGLSRADSRARLATLAGTPPETCGDSQAGPPGGRPGRNPGRSGKELHRTGRRAPELGPGSLLPGRSAQSGAVFG
jgi:hypothetical protein